MWLQSSDAEKKNILFRMGHSVISPWIWIFWQATYLCNKIACTYHFALLPERLVICCSKSWPVDSTYEELFSSQRSRFIIGTCGCHPYCLRFHRWHWDSTIIMSVPVLQPRIIYIYICIKDMDIIRMHNQEKESRTKPSAYSWDISYDKLLEQRVTLYWYVCIDMNIKLFLIT